MLSVQGYVEVLTKVILIQVNFLEYFFSLILINVSGKQQAYGLLFSVELLEILKHRIQDQYILPCPIPMYDLKFFKTMKIVQDINLKRHCYYRLFVGSVATFQRKRIPSPENFMSCQRNNPQKNVLPSLRSGGTVLPSLRSGKTTVPPSLRSGKTTFFFWFFPGCHKNSR